MRYLPPTILKYLQIVHSNNSSNNDIQMDPTIEQNPLFEISKFTRPTNLSRVNHGCRIPVNLDRNKS